MNETDAQPSAIESEIEAKFEVDASGHAALLTVDAFGAFTVVSRKQRQQDDIYFDTADAALRRAGATLRVRRLADGALMTFKGARRATAAAHVASRPEDEEVLPASWSARVVTDAPLPDGLDSSPLRRARALIGTATLLPVARLLNERVTLDLQDSAGRRLELALDHCVGTRLADGREVAFDEVELEAKQGGEAAVHAAQRELAQSAPTLRPNHGTKLARTLD
jgi:triphosphatase